MQHFLLYLKITFCLLIGFLKWKWLVRTDIVRSSCPEAFLGKGVLKLCIKFTGEHPCRSAVSIKFQRNFIENTFRYECSPIYICCIFSEHLSLRTPLDGCFCQSFPGIPTGTSEPIFLYICFNFEETIRH